MKITITVEFDNSEAGKADKPTQPASKSNVRGEKRAERLQQIEQLLALCEEHPALDHSDLAAIAKQRFQMSRSAYYRRMSGLRCRHFQGTNGASS